MKRAHDGSTVDSDWWYLVASADYAAAPHPEPDGTRGQGTPTPIDPSFQSPFLGKGLKEIAQWLRNKPANVDLDYQFFGILDQQVYKTGKVAVCRLNDPKVEKEIAWCILKQPSQSTLYLGGLDSGLDWQEDVSYAKYIPEI